MTEQTHTMIATGRPDGTTAGPGQPSERTTTHGLPLDGSQWLVGPDPELARVDHGAQPAVGGRVEPPVSRAREVVHAPVGEELSRSGLRVAVYGLHGGAGASTVAAMLRSRGVDAYDLDEDGLAEGDAGRGSSDVTVLVIRTTAAATARLHQAVRTWRARLGTPPVLVTVPDVPTGAPPAAVRYRLRALRNDYRGPIKVPWIWALREADTFDQIASTKKARTAAQQLVDELSTITHTTLGK